MNILTRRLGLTTLVFATGLAGMNLAQAEDAMKAAPMKKEAMKPGAMAPKADTEAGPTGRAAPLLSAADIPDDSGIILHYQILNFRLQTNE